MEPFALATVESDGGPQLAVAQDAAFLKLSELLPAAPQDMVTLLRDAEMWCDRIRAALDESASALPWLRRDEISLLAPVDPPNIYCAGVNFRDHIVNLGLTPPRKEEARPIVLLKATGTILRPGGTVRKPPQSNALDYELEPAVVIGHRAENVSAAAALDYVAGYTILNDVSARDLSARRDWPFMGLDFFLQKSRATFCPLGPWIAPRSQIQDSKDLTLRLRVNGTTRQESSTSEMIFTFEELIEYISGVVPLRPGDIVSGGTPGGTGLERYRTSLNPLEYLQPGDHVASEVVGIGTLEFDVV